MRDPERIDGFCERLKAIWKKYPDLRFNQLIMNVQEDRDYYTEDEEFFTRLEATYNCWATEKLETARKQKEENARVDTGFYGNAHVPIQAISNDQVGAVLEFATLGQAAGYIYNYLLIKKRKYVTTAGIKKEIKRAISTGETYLRYVWIFKQEGETKKDE